MKNITFLRKGLLKRIALGTLMLAGPFVWAQVPTVTVPSTVQVVVAGSGGTLGFGGTVGSGGIVVMPDPGSGSFTINANGATLTSWSLSGDLSFTQRPTAILQSASPSTSPRIIYSYNKVKRDSESETLARSKGRVTVGYTASACGGAISFDVYKKYSGGSLIETDPNYVPQIVGPDCWLPNKPYTYSVDQIASDNLQDGIGIDEYYWLVSSATDTITNFYTSADKSSITIQTPASVVGTWTIRCAYGRANPWDGNSSATAPHTTFVTKPVGALPLEPIYTSTLPNSCLATGTSGFNITANPSSVNSAYDYTWTVQGASWTLTQSNIHSPNVTVSGVDNNPGTLILTVEGDCEPSIFTYEINRNFTTAIAITGSTCIAAGTSNIYSLPANAQINTTSWTLPTGWSILTSGSNTPRSIANISVPAGTPAGAYTLTARSTDCPSTSISLVVNVRPATPIFTTSTTSPVGTSQNCVARDGVTAVTYTVTASPGANNYLWAFPSGWSTTSAITSVPSVTVTPGGSTTSGVVTVTARVSNAGVVSGCTSPTVNFNVNYKPVAPTAVTVTGCWTIGMPGTKSATFTNVQNYGTYTVTSTPAGLIGTGTPTVTISGTTGTITFPTTGATGTYTLTITHNAVLGSSCGSLSGTTTSSFTAAGNNAAWATNYPQYDPEAGGCDNYRVNTQPSGTTFAWFIGTSTTPLTSGGLVTISPSGNQLQLCGSTPPPGPIYCVVTQPGGCPTRISATAGAHGAARHANPDAKQTSINGTTLFPNPNDGNFTILIEDLRQSATAQIIDNSGKQVGTYTLQRGENKIESKGIASGTYTVIITIDGKKESKKIIVK